MGFFSKYTRTEKIDLGDGYHVIVHPYLSAAQKAAAEDRLISSDGQSSTMAVGTGSYSLEIAVQAIVSWNLTDELDRLLPVQSEDDRRSSLNHPLFPAFVVEKVNEAVNKAKKAAADGEAEFPRSGQALPVEPARTEFPEAGAGTLAAPGVLG